MYSVGIGDKLILNKAKLIFDNTSQLSFEEIIKNYKCVKYC